MTIFTEGDVEEAALAWLAGLSWSIVHGPDIAPAQTATAEAGVGGVAGDTSEF